MTDNWSGFTEAEIRLIGGNRRFQIGGDNKLLRNGGGVAVAKQQVGQRRFLKKNMMRERMLNGDKKPSYNVSPPSSIPKDARLYIPQIPEEEEDEVEEDNKKSETTTTGVDGGTEEKAVEEKACLGPILKSHSIEISASKLLQEPGDVARDGAEPSIDALTKFQEKQKMMEEHNRQRKELLQKALADRTKKTREEAKRLNQIEEELKRLDAMLSNDVSIIRDQIEAASHDFMEAQKRYDKAEREFLEAKLCLFSHKERKELLTGHLCTIIEQNEIRKAKKLSDLMEKLQLAPSQPPTKKEENEEA